MSKTFDPNSASGAHGGPGAEAPPRADVATMPTAGTPVRRRRDVPLALNLGVFFATWEIVQRFAPLIDPRWIPPPSEIAGRLTDVAVSGELQYHLVYSMRNVSFALLLAVLSAIPIGLCMGGLPMMRTVLGPYLWALYAAPTVAIAPIVTLVFGMGAASAITVIMLAAFFPLAINTMDGVATVDQTLIRAARVFGATRVVLFRRVVLPYTLPWVLTGLRIAATRALLGMLVVELFFSPRGLGYLIKKASDVSDAATAYGIIVLVVSSSVLLVQIVALAERRLTPWKQTLEL